MVGSIACQSIGGAEEDLSIVVSDAPQVSVTGVDGDSLRGDDGTEYRLAAINAPDSPECLADEAADRLAGMVAAAGGTISIIEPENERFDQFDRQLIYAFVDDGATFVNQVLVEDGLALAIHAGASTSSAEILFAAQDQAREDEVGIWDPQACGDGPIHPVEVLDVVANPPGPDEGVLDDEYVVVGNSGPDPIDLTGWMIRDESTQNRYSFPPGFVIGPGEEVTVTSGDGDFGFGMDSPIWNNGGDTVLLVDDQGRFVTYLTVTG